MKNYKTPKIGVLASVIVDIKKHYDIPRDGLDVTLGWTPETGGWGWQTGDNSYTGAAYGHPVWAVDTIMRRTNSKQLARDLINQLLEQVSQ